ncbi:DUF5615 family PIN-like protein [Actinoplanes italicus]|uniref:DUF5615 domain-containing protein n=1 Tax=Actinoplanes italicus TaxID=113567 RepID=A0A2T0JXZ2_9ACTN|nr:DUF5615 family PIN-like protein [Actinoplanes italicus]PRX13344.1 hypothetical protein CLV67_12556 [Actinoplanes italicus]
MTGLLLGEMYPPSLAQQLRDAGHDAVAVLDIEVGLASKTDEDVLAWAARNNRCVVTENVADFLRLAHQGAGHAGLILVTRRRFPRTRSGLHRLGKALTDFLSTETPPGRDQILWLPDS